MKRNNSLKLALCTTIVVMLIATTISCSLSSYTPSSYTPSSYTPSRSSQSVDKSKCALCKGTGKNANGTKCNPCNGTGKPVAFPE